VRDQVSHLYTTTDKIMISLRIKCYNIHGLRKVCRNRKLNCLSAVLI
jgi:hypothetical protein